jgi:drug/metabolite transporter (DMT)-like permease
MNFTGELAALATSFLFAMTAFIFTTTGRMIGSQATNRMRLAFALAYLMILNVILFREPLPFSAESSRWLWLSLSGVIGLSLGDAFLFQSLISMGPRLGTLLLSLAPIFGSIIAWIFFGERLSPLQITGILLALAGIGWVVLSHKEPPYAPWTYKARRTLRRACRTGAGGRACSLEAGDVWRFLSIPGERNSYARRSDFYLGVDCLGG